MANINGINSAGAPRPIQPTDAAKVATSQKPAQASDSVEISFEAQIASKLAAVPDIREDLVADVKAQIQAGTYETMEKLDAAIANMIAEL